MVTAPQTILYVQNKEKKTERLDLRVKPSTIQALELLKNSENYNTVGIDGNFTEDSISDILEYGLKMLVSTYLKFDNYTGIYPDVVKLYDGLYGNDIVNITGQHALTFKKEYFS